MFVITVHVDVDRRAFIVRNYILYTFVLLALVYISSPFSLKWLYYKFDSVRLQSRSFCEQTSWHREKYLETNVKKIYFQGVRFMRGSYNTLTRLSRITTFVIEEQLVNELTRHSLTSSTVMYDVIP